MTNSNLIKIKNYPSKISKNILMDSKNHSQTQLLLRKIYRLWHNSSMFGVHPCCVYTCLDISCSVGVGYAPQHYHGLGLSYPSLTCLGLGKIFRFIFISNGHKHIVRVQYSIVIFFKTSHKSFNVLN